MPEVKVLIIDRSKELREGLAKALAHEEDISVTSILGSCETALLEIERRTPDVVLMDVETTGALDCLDEINAFNAKRDQSIGVIVSASRAQKGAELTIKALESGAYDFAAKPLDSSVEAAIHSLLRQLIVKSRFFHSRLIFSDFQSVSPVAPMRRKRNKVEDSRYSPELRAKMPSRIRAIALGISTGGPQALSELLPYLSANLAQPILVVQHMPPHFTASLAERLNDKCAHRVVEARDGQPVEDNHIYIAPGGSHMKVMADPSVGMRLQVTDEAPEDGCKPSTNVLFRSVASVYGKRAIGIVMTGMGMDGAKGAVELKRSGGYIIAQDKLTSIVWGMPGSAVSTGCVDMVLPLEDIGPHIVDVVSGGTDG